MAFFFQLEVKLSFLSKREQSKLTRRAERNSENEDNDFQCVVCKDFPAKQVIWPTF